MDGKTPEVEVSPEVSAFLDEPATRLELVQMVQPLRAAIIPIFQASMNSLVMLIEASEDSELKAKARQAFEQLDRVFLELDKFDDRIDNIFEGKPTWSARGKEADNE